jgi:hypothetical protein
MTPVSSPLEIGSLAAVSSALYISAAVDPPRSYRSKVCTGVVTLLVTLAHCGTVKASIEQFKASRDGHQTDRKVKRLKAIDDVKQKFVLLVQVVMKKDNDGGLIGIVLLILDLAAPDQALAALDKVMGRSLFKVIRAKRTLKRGFIVAVASGADGH